MLAYEISHVEVTMELASEIKHLHFIVVFGHEGGMDMATDYEEIVFRDATHPKALLVNEKAIYGKNIRKIKDKGRFG